MLHKICSMDYKLKILSSSRVYPIFHVSCLKKLTGEKISIETILLKLDEEGKFISKPKQITKIMTEQL